MTQKKLALIFVIGLLIISGIIFVSLSQSQSQTTSSNSKSDQQTQISPTPQTTTQLSVLPHQCIGCGRCRRLDPQHFDLQNRQAVVISSLNLDSPALTSAIASCPTQAIVLK